MQYILIAIVLMVLCVFGLSCRKGPALSIPPKPAGPVTNVASGTYLSRQDIEAQLAIIAKNPPSEWIGPNAMCYSPLSVPIRADYVCPLCGERTLYSIEHTTDPNDYRPLLSRMSKIQDKVEPCRRIIQQINTLDVTLDESQFCGHCNRYVEDAKLGLIVRYPGQSEPHRVGDINPEDLRMIQAAAEGRLKYEDGYGYTIPLKAYLDRLEELLGVKLNDTE